MYEKYLKAFVVVPLFLVTVAGCVRDTATGSNEIAYV